MKKAILIIMAMLMMAGMASAERTCTDNDPENDIYTASNVTGTRDDGIFFVLSDRCLPYRGLIQETLCDSANNPGTMQKECAEGETCSEGRCMASATVPTCTDSDPENDVHVLGSVSGTDNTGTDFVWNDECDAVSGKVVEGTCIVSSAGLSLVDYEYKDCPPREACVGGKCERSTLVCDPPCDAKQVCVDTDGSGRGRCINTIDHVRDRRWEDIRARIKSINLYLNTIEKSACGTGLPTGAVTGLPTGLCAAPPGMRSNGQPCYADEQCTSNFCDMSTLRCAAAPDSPVKANGEACTLNAQCRTGYCNMSGAVCATPPGMRSNGQPCYADEQCTSNFCDMSTLRCAAAPDSPVKANGEACTLNAQCRTGYCNMAVTAATNAVNVNSFSSLEVELTKIYEQQARIAKCKGMASAKYTKTANSERNVAALLASTTKQAFELKKVSFKASGVKTPAGEKTPAVEASGVKTVATKTPVAKKSLFGRLFSTKTPA